MLRSNSLSAYNTETSALLVVMEYAPYDLYSFAKIYELSEEQKK